MEKRKALKTVRTNLELTCQDIADVMHVTKQTISNIESGKSKQRHTMKFYELVLLSLLDERLTKGDLSNSDIFELKIMLKLSKEA